MNYQPPLEKAHLIKRYKRFLADVKLPSGEVITIHCPNTGSMKNCAEPGFEVYYSTSDNKKRKYPHTWELARSVQGHMIGVNTHKANHLVKEAIETGKVSELVGYETIKTEVKYGAEKSRIDLLLSHQGKPDCYVEVKNVTLLEAAFNKGAGFFPDAVSERGRKHLRELVSMVKQGQRAVLFYCVQHSGIQSVQAAKHIDPAYAEALEQAAASGVEIIAYRSEMSAQHNQLQDSLPVLVGELVGKLNV